MARWKPPRSGTGRPDKTGRDTHTHTLETDMWPHPVTNRCPGSRGSHGRFGGVFAEERTALPGRTRGCRFYESGLILFFIDDIMKAVSLFVRTRNVNSRGMSRWGSHSPARWLTAIDGKFRAQLVCRSHYRKTTPYQSCNAIRLPGRYVCARRFFFNAFSCVSTSLPPRALDEF